MSSTSDLDDLASRKDDLKTEHVVSSNSVFNAARSSCVGGDIAAETAFFQTGWIRRIKKTFFTRSNLKIASG